MKQVLSFIALLGAVGIGLLVYAVVSVGNDWANRRADRDASALAALPPRPFAPMIRLDIGKPDLVVFQDSEEGWFELDIETLPPDLEIGFHGPRFLDALAGSDHVPLYCSGDGRDGKTIWVVQNGDIARDFAFCNPRRMDLASLRPFASPVVMTYDQGTRAEIEALLPAIATDPSRAMVAGPGVMSPYSMRVVMTPPLMWFSYTEGPPRHLVEPEMEAAIRDHMGDVAIRFLRRPGSNPNLALPPEHPSAGGGANMAIRQDAGHIVIPDFWAEPYQIWIDCNPEACARAETLDLATVFAQARDLSALRRAIDQITAPPQTDAPAQTAMLPTMAQLEDDRMTLAAPIDVTYPIRYITRP